MSITQLLENILQERQVVDADGNRLPLHSHISPQKGKLLQDLIAERQPRQCLEIGCAYGISSLYFAAALTHSDAHLTIIDPYQSSQWQGIGVKNLQEAGFTRYTLHELGSEIALPQFLQIRQQFDFVFIDGWHTFDHALLDFFYVNRMLKTGGIVVFDDTDFPSLHQLMAYIRQYPAYRQLAAVSWPLSAKRKLAEKWLLPPVRGFAALIPQPYRNALFRPQALNRGASFHVHTSMTAFEKIADDTRNWDWFAPF
jgi:predicted O-methyltransferase YrrM